MWSPQRGWRTAAAATAQGVGRATAGNIGGLIHPKNRPFESAAVTSQRSAVSSAADRSTADEDGPTTDLTSDNGPTVDLVPTPAIRPVSRRSAPVPASSSFRLAAATAQASARRPSTTVSAPGPAYVPSSGWATSHDSGHDTVAGSDPEVDIRPVDPDIHLVGPHLLDPEASPAAPVDGVAVMVIGPKARSPHLVYANDGLCELVGCRSDQLIGQSPAVFFTPEDGPDEIEAMKQALVPKRDSTLLELLDGSGIEGSSAADSYQHTVVDQWVREHGEWATIGADPGDEYVELGSINVERDGSESITIDLSSAVGDRSYSSLTHLVDRDGNRIPVLFTAHLIASAGGSYPNVVAQFRDLRRASAERLLADKEAVISSLRRGHQLGQLCHQISIMIEKSLGVQATCWISMMAADDEFEPVIAGGFDADIVAAATGALARSSNRPTKRVASIRGLAAPLADALRANGITNLWYVPIMVDGEVPDAGSEGFVVEERQMAAIVVVTDDATPDREATELLDHLAQVLSAGISHASIESDNAHNALHDPLTRLPNRALIVDRLGQAMARLERDGVALSVLLVDIDRFKNVNDSRGIEAGDQVLIEVANRLLAAVRLGDTVGRISSDQFLVMCVAANGELDTTSVARRVLRSLSEPIAVGEGDDIRITASVGAVLIKEAGRSPASVISNAESALADAESTGRGKFAMFKAEHQHDVVVRHRTEQALHRAIIDDELVMHYQPLVEIRTGYMIGAEALVRWERPGYGLLGPGEFIPVAEESELIVPMGEWVIDQVCEDLADWPKSRGRLPLVSVNLGARHLEVDTLVPTVIRALQRNGLHPRRLGFEITESMQVADQAAALANLNKLSELGCRIAIDDFGVGHASLDYLRRFPMATALKIDRSFVAGLNRSREDRAIVTASIAMARELGLQSVAEGVESVEQLLTLRDMGCRYAQGFILSRPLPLDIVLRIWDKAQLYRSAALISES